MNRRVKNINLTIAVATLLVVSATQPVIAENKQKSEWAHGEEGLAYHIRGEERQSKEKEAYMKRLSAGGKIYFLACRQDWKESLDLLEKFPHKDTGSALYVKAYCLEKLKRHEEAIMVYSRAKSKVDMIFNPGFKFYFHFADAQINGGQLGEALKNIDMAESKYQTAPKYGYTGQAAFNMMRRLKYVILEKDEQYEKAFAGYCEQLDPHKRIPHLNEKLVVTKEKQKNAEAFLRENPKPPAQDRGDDYVNHWLSTGNAYLLLGKTAKAKACYEKVEAYKPWYEVRKTKLAEDDAPLKEGKLNAQLSMLKLLYAEKDFKKCCIQIRNVYDTLGVNPVEYAEHKYAVISMKDVPQLVLQQDVDLHSQIAETVLDKEPFVSGLQKEKLKGERRTAFERRRERRLALFADDPLLTRAHRELQQKDFARCSATLDQFLRVNSHLSLEHKGYYQGRKAGVFDRNFVYQVRLLQLAVGYASGRKSQTLSFRVYSEPLHSARWDAIEDRLLGRRGSNTASDLEKFRHEPEFAAWCHVAAGVNMMSTGNYKGAGREFGMVTLPEEILHLADYMSVLKAFCERQK